MGRARNRVRVRVGLILSECAGICQRSGATRWSIDFATQINVEPDPLTVEYYSPCLPEPDDGLITATMEIEVGPENHIRFFHLMKEIRLIYLRNGAFSARLDQDFEPYSILFMHPVPLASTTYDLRDRPE